MMIKEQDVPLLIVYNGSLSGTRWSLEKEHVTLGRSPDCDIVFLERQISRYHARVERDDEGYLLRDLGSKNGTQVNEDVVRGQSYRLRDGDEITLAATVRLGFVAGDATLPLDEIMQPEETLELDEAARRVTLGRRELDPPLSPSQFKLLALLVQHAGDVVRREEVIEEIWPEAVGGVTDQAVDALVYRLRERLAELDPDHEYVVTVRGHGFRLDV
ncbi:MAG: FHA domain-containing protein [Anaerolineae bacterium]